MVVYGMVISVRPLPKRFQRSHQHSPWPKEYIYCRASIGHHLLGLLLTASHYLGHPFQRADLNLGLCIDNFFLDSVHIIDVVGPGEEIEDGRTLDAVDLG